MMFMLMALAVAANSVEVTGADSVRYAGRNYSLYRIDAPQLSATCPLERTRAAETAALVRTLIARGARVEITPGYDPRGRRLWPRDRFGRRLAHISIDGVDLGAALIAQGRAVPWNNRQKYNWCQSR